MSGIRGRSGLRPARITEVACGGGDLARTAADVGTPAYGGGMCGRFVVANVASELVGVLRVDVETDELPPPSYKHRPHVISLAIVLDSVKTEPPVRRLGSRAGGRPGWAKDVKIGARAFNARSEEIEDKPMFRNA